MSKKLILCIFCSLACITMACSDDKDNDSYKEGAACTENRVGGIGGLCDGNTSVKCINGHIRIRRVRNAQWRSCVFDAQHQGLWINR